MNMRSCSRFGLAVLILVTISALSATTTRHSNEYWQNSVSGIVFHDLNINGTKQTNEPGLDFIVRLTGPVSYSSVPNQDGEYSFNNIEPGSYLLSIDIPQEWTIINTDYSGAFSITISASTVISNKNFATFNLVRSEPGPENVTIGGMSTGTSNISGQGTNPQSSAPINPNNRLYHSLSINASANCFAPDTVFVTHNQIIPMYLTSSDNRTHVIVFDGPELSGISLSASPGETRGIAFKAYNMMPGEAYSYHCDVPGHASWGESGVIMVKNLDYPNITIISPNGNEILGNVSNQFQVTWTSSGNGSIFIQLSIDNGASWSLLNDIPIDAMLQEYIFDLPDITSTQCFIRILDSDHYHVYDVSDQSFTIVPSVHISILSDIRIGICPTTVQFSGVATHIDNGDPTWAWDLNEDGIVDSYEQNPLYTYTVPGIYDVSLSVTWAGAVYVKSVARLITVKEELLSGKVYCWGDLPQGSGESNVIKIACGDNHILFLKEDGSLDYWENPRYSGAADLTVPEGNDYVDVSASINRSLVLRSDGSMYSWGSNYSGITSVPEGNDFIAIAAGGYHNVGLRSDGSIAAAGRSTSGNLNCPPGNDFVQISAGQYHSLALRSDGSVAAWGWNSSGECSVPSGNNFKAVAAGYTFSLFLRTDGSLYACGGGDIICNVPSGNDFIAIAAGNTIAIALREDGSIVAWGRNQLGECNTSHGSGFVMVGAGYRYSAAIRRGLAVDITSDIKTGHQPLEVQFTDLSESINAGPDINSWEWDFNEDGVVDSNIQNPAWIYNLDGVFDVTLKIGNGIEYQTMTFKDYITVSSLTIDFISDIQFGFTPLTVNFTDLSSSLIQEYQVTSWAWDFDGDGIVDSYAQNPIYTYTNPGRYSVCLTASSNLASTSTIKYGYITCFEQSSVTGTHVVSWGRETDNIPSGIGMLSISTYDNYSVALVGDGRIVTWGSNIQMVGSSPDESGFIKAVAGYSHGIALKSDGSLRAWGNNFAGECNVPPGNNYIDVAAGQNVSYALRSDGSIVGWGSPSIEQLNIPGGNDFVSLCSSYNHGTYAIRIDGSTAFWGRNGSVHVSIPQGVAFRKIVSGYFYSVGLLSDGSLVSWGAGYAPNSPEGNDFIDVVSGVNHCLALKSDGSVVAWGDNQYNQCNVPDGLSVIAISAGYGTSMAVTVSALGTPGNITIEHVDSCITINWDPVNSYGLPIVYEIHASRNPYFSPNHDTLIGVTTSTQFLDQNLDSFSKFYRIIAKACP
jgi:PKD repeat protein